MEIFGDWQYNIDKLNYQFNTNIPFEHVVIDNFFKDTYADKLYNSFPNIEDKSLKWIKYHNPIEKKYAINDFSKIQEYEYLFNILQSTEFVNIMSKITSIHNLEKDPYLHGAGIHYHPTGGKLDMHLDYSIHPKTGKERRINMIIYMNKEWDESYNGELQLWDKDFKKCDKKYYPTYNKAVIFKTSDLSYHGLPIPIKCPENMGRKSIAIYYVSDLQENVTHRYKAQFKPLPNQPVNDKLKKLYDIRETRIITDKDLQEIYPDWENDGGEFW